VFELCELGGAVAVVSGPNLVTTINASEIRNRTFSFGEWPKANRELRGNVASDQTRQRRRRCSDIRARYLRVQHAGERRAPQKRRAER
jgi:hypothetical protein